MKNTREMYIYHFSYNIFKERKYVHREWKTHREEKNLFQNSPFGRKCEKEIEENEAERSRI